MKDKNVYIQEKINAIIDYYENIIDKLNVEIDKLNMKIKKLKG